MKSSFLKQGKKPVTKCHTATPSMNYLAFCGHSLVVASGCVIIYVLSRYSCDGRKVSSGGAIDNDTNANGYCKASPILLD